MNVCHVFVLLLTFVTADAARTRRPSFASDCDDKGCSHECVSVGEFPLCVCPPDMVLESDGKNCRDSNSFLLAMFRGVRIYNEESQEEETVTPAKARCLDYHYGRKELYAFTNNTIMRYPLSKGKTASSVSMVTRTDTTVTSLAVDWVNDVIYYISEQQLLLSVTSLEGKDQRNILAHNDSSSAGWRNLVVDPQAKRLFWIGSEGVYSSNLEGKSLVKGLVSWIFPDKIALDTKNQLIYVIGRRGDSSNKVVSRASYNGTKVGEDVEIEQPATAGIFGFGLLGDTAYWESNHDGENIYKCNLKEGGKSGKAKATLVAELNQIVYDMKIYHKEIQN